MQSKAWLCDQVPEGGCGAEVVECRNQDPQTKARIPYMARRVCDVILPSARTANPEDRMRDSDQRAAGDGSSASKFWTGERATVARVVGFTAWRARPRGRSKYRTGRRAGVRKRWA